MVNNILVTRPEHDFTTRYISAWADEYIKLASSKGFTVIDLRRERASREEFESVIEKKNPIFVVMNGHGNTNEVTGCENKTIIKLSDNLASFFLKPSNAIPVALLKGHTVGNAVSKAKFEFSRNIRNLLRSNTSSDDYSTVRYLVWNMKNLVAHGDCDKKILT